MQNFIRCNLKISRWLEHHWYQSSFTLLTIFLLPFSWVFRGLVAVRRFLYRKKIKKTFRFAVPVIIVGNITVGGTGKTPLVIWLTHFLKQQGFQPGMVSRGVGGNGKRAPRWVNENSSVISVGDEALLLFTRTNCPMVIGVDRVAAVKELLNKTNCDVVICDDGLQHYRLERDVEIAVIDGLRGLGNQQFLPAGPLREAPSRLSQVDFIVRHGRAEQGEYLMQLRGDFLISLNDKRKKSLTDFKNQTVHAVAGVGNPKRFFNALREKGIHVIEHVFPDHYLYRERDIFFNDELPIIMTEKDAVKCFSFSNQRCWYFPVEADIDEKLGRAILKKFRVS